MRALKLGGDDYLTKPFDALELGARVESVLRRKEQELQYLTIDPHSPAEFRANIVRNLDEFVTAFGVEPGDGLWLDPEDRVRIW